MYDLTATEEPIARRSTHSLPITPSFTISAANKTYKHQYSNIYFVRLRTLRDTLEARALKRWKKVAGDPILVPRVLEVTKGKLCYVVGTVYLDMPLKPNVLEDIARDHSIPPPPPKAQFYSEEDSVMLEDESGRIRLVGDRLSKTRLVTGVIMGALGVETQNGDFEVVDLCFAGLAPQAGADEDEEDERMDVDDVPPVASNKQEWIAMISGLDIDATSSADAQINMFVEYLTGESGNPEDQAFVSQISRLVIAGNSLAPAVLEAPPAGVVPDKKPRRYGYDAGTFSAHPTLTFSSYLMDIANTMPVHLLPGSTDPAGTILPQQPFPRAMFGSVASLPSFTCETNPTYIRVASRASDETSPKCTRTLLVNSGQPLNDMFKYLPTTTNPPIKVAESTLRWRHMAPTAPDTLWCHPYFTTDPFLIPRTPDIYIVGNQPYYATQLVKGDAEDVEEGKAKGGVSAVPRKCRIVLLPSFAETGILVLVNMRTLATKTVQFTVDSSMVDLDAIEE